MTDIKDILESVLTDEKLLSSRSFRDKVYSDQPILKRASQIKTPQTPQKIKDMKALAYTPEAYWKTSAWLFYTQGTFMADFSDVYEYNADFIKYYPTYRDLDTEQLRGYFSWRSRVRNGEFRNAPLPFIYMYAYEMINNIGIGSPEEGLDQLKRLTQSYGDRDHELKRLLLRWIVDHCVYYRLPPENVADVPDIAFDSSLLTLIHWEEADDDKLFSAMLALSGYPVEQSRFYIQYPEKYKQAAVRVFRGISAFFRDHRKNSLCDKFFGHMTEMNCRMFESSVFYDRNTTRNADYELNEIHSYTCRNGVWRCRKYYGNRGRNSQLGELMKTVDSLMRQRCDFRYKLRPAEISKTTLSLITKELDAIDEENRRAKAMKIEIDLSKLEGIRAAADITRDKLIVEEEVTEPVELPPVTEPEPVPQQEHTDSPLSDSEKRFLSALLSGGDWSVAAREAGEMPSLLSDSINDKLFDIFGDTVIDYSADVPEIIEDYIDELRRLVI